MIRYEFISERRARLTEDYRFTMPNGYVTIPAGYEWDGATIPRIGWTMVGLTPFGAHDEATLRHDYLYGYEGVIPFYPVKLSRRFVDELLFADLEKLGFKGLQLTVIKLFVRVGGYYFWREF